MTLIALTGLDGSAVQVQNLEVCSLNAVPAALLPAGVAVGTYVDTENGKRVPVQGAINTTGTALQAPGDMALVLLTGLDAANPTPAVNPALVTALNPTPTGVSVGTYVDTADGRRIPVTGNVAANGVLLAAGNSFTASGVQYTPAITSSGAGVLIVPVWNAFRIGKFVLISGTLNFDPAAAGVAETLTIPLPTTMQPTAVFATVGQAQGITNIQTLVAATDFTTKPNAVVGARTVSFAATINAANADISVTFSYQI